MSYKKAYFFLYFSFGSCIFKKLKEFDIEPMGVARSNIEHCIDLIHIKKLHMIICESNIYFDKSYIVYLYKIK